MGEDNIAIKSYTMYYDGQPLGSVGELAFTEVEEPEDTYINLDDMNKTFTAKFKIKNSYSLLDMLYPNWRLKRMNNLYKTYKKKRKKHQNVSFKRQEIA